MNELTTHVQENMPWCMLFANDIVLVDESRDGMSAKLKNGGRLHNLKQVAGRRNTNCSFSAYVQINVTTMRIEAQEMTQRYYFDTLAL